jgi:hypothetical protein
MPEGGGSYRSNDVRAAGQGVKLTYDDFLLFPDDGKRHEYEREGASEYWVVDPELDAIRVFRRADDRFERALELAKRRDVLTTPLLPGLEIEVTRIFAGPPGTTPR